MATAPKPCNPELFDYCPRLQVNELLLIWSHQMVVRKVEAARKQRESQSQKTDSQ